MSKATRVGKDCVRCGAYTEVAVSCWLVDEGRRVWCLPCAARVLAEWGNEPQAVPADNPAYPIAQELARDPTNDWAPPARSPLPTNEVKASEAVDPYAGWAPVVPHWE